ncbi:baseplate J/gp47 family protein [Leptospira licerasiae]|uniref:Baseplate J-like protein n=1 Tax=Leptospira licerasiae str. MMD4847 TaxID=1049971 RepID=A0ABN0H9J9_9LEPT|nr:baseplate J/gp47 family protein [Leptospira licerasiae]EIE01461.1 baseplate J-like protein [Leptospira licerasiae serovar Varillal str. VAR 010]EJZ42293.1 baseplate J-like protein [Leptospira licerasiae str. MMD4847]
MGSPAPYIPKTFLEYNTALINYLVAQGSRLTNFNPNSRISTIIRAIATILSEGDIRTLNGFRYSIREGVYNAFGFSRLPGNLSSGFVRIENNGIVEPLSIPIFSLDLFGLGFESVAPVNLQVNQPYVEVELRATKPGTDYNIRRLSIDTAEGLGSLSIPLPSNVRLWNTADFGGGTNFETEESRLRRFRDFIVSLGRSTPLGIYNAASSIPGVAGVQLSTNVNPLSGNFEIGWINIYVSDGTSNPPPELLNLVRKTIEGDLDDPENFPGYAAAGTYVYVAPVPVLGITVEFELEILNDSQLTNTDALNTATNALILYLNTLPVGFDVLLEQVIATILKSHPDFYRVNIQSFFGKLANDPIPSPLPSPIDISVPDTYLPRTGGTSGGQVNGTIVRTEPT